MPDASEPQPLVDLSDLRLMPKWVADFGKSSPSKLSDQPEEDTRERRDRRGPRDFSGGGFRGERREGGGGFRGERREGGPRGDRRDGPPRGERKPFEKPFDRRDRGGPRGDRRDRGNFRGRDDRDRGPHFEAPPVVPGLITHIEPENKSTEALAATIRAAGKAFSVFDAARLVLQSGDRFHVKFVLPKDATIKLCTIPADGSVWLGREEAVAHFLNSEGLKEFYRVEEIELEEPKGNFASVAVCGMSGEILGPASHHSYQTALHRIHRERFSNMAFEDYKRRVRTDNSPEAVEKWKDAQKRGQVWVYLTPSLEDGAEPLKLKSRGEMESHFRQHHAQTLVHETTEAWVAGNIPKQNLSPALYHALRRGVDEARKHLLPIAQLLCTGFEGHGLKLFKRRGGKLWVSRTRPRALDSSTVLSDRIAKMLEVVKAKPGIAVKELVEIISPANGQPEIAAPVETVASPAAESAAADVPADGGTTPVSSEDSPPAPAAQQHEWSTEQLQALKDLHWLNSEGYVIEYADGIVFIGVTEPPPPKPKPVKPAPAGETPAGVEEPESSAPVAMDADPADNEPAAEPFSLIDDPEPAPSGEPAAQE